MARAPFSARISPTIRLESVEIRLSDYEAPTVQMTGRVNTGSRRVDMATTVTIKTGAIGPAGRAFLEELRTSFAAQAPAKATTGE